MLFGSNGNNNIPLAGCTNTTVDQYAVNGYNPCRLRECSCWCVVCNTVNNTCMNRYVNNANEPKIYAGPQLTSNFSIGYIRNKDRIHGVNLIVNFNVLGCVRFTSPFTTAWRCATSYMYCNLPLSNQQSYVTIQACATYGSGIWREWRANSSSGNCITNCISTSLYTTGTYGGTTYRLLRNVYGFFDFDTTP